MSSLQNNLPTLIGWKLYHSLCYNFHPINVGKLFLKSGHFLRQQMFTKIWFKNSAPIFNAKEVEIYASFFWESIEKLID